VNLSICSHASNTKEYENGFKTNPLRKVFKNTQKENILKRDKILFQEI
jgi:hypothetical protein